MEPFLPELHPNPGWGDSCEPKDIEAIQINSSENLEGTAYSNFTNVIMRSLMMKLL